MTSLSSLQGQMRGKGGEQINMQVSVAVFKVAELIFKVANDLVSQTGKKGKGN